MKMVYLCLSCTILMFILIRSYGDGTRSIELTLYGNEGRVTLYIFLFTTISFLALLIMNSVPKTRR